MPDSDQPRRPLRFSLAALFTAVTLMGVLFGVFRVFWERELLFFLVVTVAFSIAFHSRIRDPFTATLLAAGCSAVLNLHREITTTGAPFDMVHLVLIWPTAIIIFTTWAFFTAMPIGLLFHALRKRRVEPARKAP